MVLSPLSAFAAGNAFDGAAKLLAAAKNGNIQQVQMLIASGANVNYVDSTGLSVVCTAIMNNDIRAAQILQMYGADASNCDRQIKQYNMRNTPASTGGMFSGLSTTHGLVLAGAATAAVVGGLFLLTDIFDPGNKNNNSSSSGNRPNSDGSGSGGDSSATASYTLPAATADNDVDTFYLNDDFEYMKPNNYLLMARAYNALARGYNGWQTIRASDNTPFNLSTLPFVGEPGNGKPVGIALITENGVNPDGSIGDGLLSWVDKSKVSAAQSACSTYGSDSSQCTSAVAAAIKVSRKYYNRTSLTDLDDTTENTDFDLSGTGTVFGVGDDTANLAARIIAGWEAGGRSDADAYGFVPNAQLVVYRTGGGNNGTEDIKTFQAMLNAARLMNSGEYVVNAIANVALHPDSYNYNYPTINSFKADLALNNLTTETGMRNAFSIYIDGTTTNPRYNQNTSDDNTNELPSTYAAALYLNISNYQNQIIVNSVGGYNMGQNLALADATFENYAPALYTDLEHLFMSVVPVQHKYGTSSINSISGYTGIDSNAGKIVTSTWTDSDSNVYRARKCGVAGVGVGSVDPWCFSAPGVNATAAVASMAGAIGTVKSAFDYMNPQQIFLLLAITADGPYLGTNPESTAAWANQSDLITYLRNRYELPGQYSGIADSEYLQTFKEVFGYGLINLERATRPDLKVFYYDGTENVVTTGGNSYWRAASQSAFRPSGALNPRGATIKMSAYDILTSADGEISLPRVWNNSFALNTDSSRHALYMGDVLGELPTRKDNDSRVTVGEFGFSMSRSNRAYADNMNGLESMRVDWTSGRWNLAAGYQHYLTDGVVRFTAMSNPILNLAHDAVVSDAEFVAGRWSFGGRAFSGRITDEGLLENDPAISENYAPARLGGISGVAANIGWHGDKFSFATSVGGTHESDTILGARTDGLLALGRGDTTYIDAEMQYDILSDLTLTARATFAQTRASGGEFISDVSDLYSNAFGVGAQWRGLSLAATMPLGVYRGYARYPYAEYSVVESAGGGYDLMMSNAGLSEIDMRPNSREVRFSATYMCPLGEFTDGAFGFIYRVNPNHTNEYGNESIFMLKLNHRIGI